MVCGTEPVVSVTVSVPSVVSVSVPPIVVSVPMVIELTTTPPATSVAYVGGGRWKWGDKAAAAAAQHSAAQRSTAQHSIA